MSPLDRRFGLDVLLSIGLVTLIAAGVLLALDAVEAATQGGAWALISIARLPGRLVLVLPILGAIGALRVTLTWQQRGEWLSSELVGVSPARMAVVGGVAGLLAGIAVAAARETVAPAAASTLAGPQRWAWLDGPVPDGVDADSVRIRADSWDGDAARGVRVAWMRDGRVVGGAELSEARWEDGVWVSDGSAWAFAADTTPIAPALPDPSQWRAAALGPGPDSGVLALAGSRPSPIRDAWLAGSPSGPLGAAGMAATAIGLTARWGRNGAFAAIAAAVVWRFAQADLVEAAARGSGSAVVAGLAPLVALLVVAALSARS